MIFEFDFDGTLVDTHKAVEDILRPQYPGCSFQKAKTYKLSENNIDAPLDEVVKAFNNPKIYENVAWIEGAISFINRLLWAGHRVVIHSLCWTEDIARAKEALIRKTFGERVEVAMDLDVKTALDSDVVFEDCPENLINSMARHKVLVSKSYNKKKHNPQYKALYEECKLIDNYKQMQMFG